LVDDSEVRIVGAMNEEVVFAQDDHMLRSTLIELTSWDPED
jgi:hypothetical protein